MSLINILKRKNKKILYTTPSHDGKLCLYHKFYQWYKSDISEVEAYNPEEALKEAEKKASKIYKTQSTHFLTNGSTSGIISAVLSCCTRDDTLLIWDKSHPCHKNAGILSGANIIQYKLPYNHEWGIYENIAPTYIAELIQKYKPKAIIITSPSYEGIVSDIPKIKQICVQYNTYLIVDEAHGALYPFSEELPESSIKYADFTIQSLHKTAGGINPTALIHSNCDIDPQEALKLVNTTSPSYPMLTTIEANINYLNSSRGKKDITNLISTLKDLRQVEFKNIKFYGNDITKILIKHEKLSGQELSELLFDTYNIEDERTNTKSTMLLTGLGTTKEKLLKLKRALLKIDKIT